MKRKAALFVAMMALFFLGCLPPTVEPPEPPVLAVRQRQKQWMENYKRTGVRGHGLVIVKVEP